MDIALTIISVTAGVYVTGTVGVAMYGIALRFGTTRESLMGAHLITRCWAWPAILWRAAGEGAKEIRDDAQEWRATRRPF